MGKNSWKVSEIRWLTEAVRQARAPREIQIPGRTEAAIRHMACRLGLIGDGISRRPWREEERARLRDLVAAGHSAIEISEMGTLPGHTCNAIKKQMQRMALADPIRSARQKNAVRLRDDQLEKFHAFLRENGRDCTPEQIARLWNEEFEPQVAHRTVLYHLSQLGMRLPRKVVVRMAYSRLKRQPHTAAFVAREQARRQKLRLELETDLHGLADRLKSSIPEPELKQDLRTCPQCHQSFPALETFFRPRTWQTETGPRAALSKCCVLCERRTRRRPESAIDPAPACA